MIWEKKKKEKRRGLELYIYIEDMFLSGGERGCENFDSF